MLTLLLFFMVIPPIQQGASVDLPEVQHVSREPGALREDAISITVAKDGRVFFRNIEAPRNGLPELIGDAVNRGSERKVYLSVDSRAKNAVVESVVQQIGTAGITSITIMTNEPTRATR